jgi:hypothetical protein
VYYWILASQGCQVALGNAWGTSESDDADWYTSDERHAWRKRNSIRRQIIQSQKNEQAPNPIPDPLDENNYWGSSMGLSKHRIVKMGDGSKSKMNDDHPLKPTAPITSSDGGSGFGTFGMSKKEDGRPESTTPTSSALNDQKRRSAGNC